MHLNVGEKIGILAQDYSAQLFLHKDGDILHYTCLLHPTPNTTHTMCHYISPASLSLFSNEFSRTLRSKRQGLIGVS